MSELIKRGLTILCLCVLAGCRTTDGDKAQDRAPLQAPKAEVTASHFMGSALSGPREGTLADAQLQQSWLIDAGVVAVEGVKLDGFQRLGADARLILATRGGTPVTPSARVGYDLLIRSVDEGFDLDTLLPDANHKALIHESTLALAPQTTVSLQLDNLIPADAAPEEDAAPPLPSTVIVRLSRSDDPKRYDLSVVTRKTIPVDAPAPQPSIEDEQPAEPAPGAIRTEKREETLVATRQIDQADRLLLAVPMRFADSGVEQVILDLSVQTSPDADALQEPVARLRADALKAADEVSKRFAPTSGAAQDLAAAVGLASLAQTNEASRGALAYLADASGAELAREVVLVADQPLLDLIRRSLLDKAEGLAKRDKANIGWLFERVTIDSVAAMMGDAKHPASAAVLGALVAQAGEMGRQVDALQALARRSNGIDDLNARLLVEHRLLLEDNSPAARVRAFDWLRARDRAPADYDPLGPARKRIEALARDDQLRAAAATQPTVETPQPGNQP